MLNGNISAQQAYQSGPCRSTLHDVMTHNSEPLLRFGKLGQILRPMQETKFNLIPINKNPSKPF